MILILGGTTEGRKVVGITEEVREPYYYSTKGDGQETSLQRRMWLTGVLTQTTMKAFYRKNGIRLLMDATHSFVEQLHTAVTAVSQVFGIPCVWYERIYSNLFKLLNEEVYDEYPLRLKEKCEELSELLNEGGIHRVLALTGVQSIPKLEPFWKKKESECYFRILNRESSHEIVRRAGFPKGRLIYYTPGKESLPGLLRQPSPEVVLLRESDMSGGFSEKVSIITEQGVRLYILLRPSLPPYDRAVNGMNGIRRTIKHFLPSLLPLRNGLATGTCATATASAALRRLLSPIPENRMEDASVLLPSGEKTAVPVHFVTGSFTDRRMEVSCTVIEDGGSGPDVTNGLPIVATVSIGISEEKPHTEGERQQVIQIHGGQGVDTVILPGLGLEVGGPAINTTPRQMITESLLHILNGHRPLPTVPIHVTISVPGGEEVAARTFNPRLGVVGGISIIGTSGIVKSFSSGVFVSSIRKEMSVARTIGSPRIVINSGAKNEKYIRSLYPELPSQAFVHYGNFIGETIRMATELDIRQLTLGVVISKAVRLAEGHLDVHSKKVTMNKEFLKKITRQSGCNTTAVTAIRGITLVREFWGLLPGAELQAFCSLLIERCHRHCDPLLPDEELTILLITGEGKVVR